MKEKQLQKSEQENYNMNVDNMVTKMIYKVLRHRE